MCKTVADKMGIRDGMRAIILDAPEAAYRALALPPLDIANSLRGKFEYIHVFATSQDALDTAFQKTTRHLGPRGMLWVSWPKNRQLGTDLTLPDVIRIGYSHGLVESKTISVDATWSAIKFTHPVAGKRYRNSFGRLPTQPE